MPRAGVPGSRPPLQELHTTGRSRRLRRRGGDGAGRTLRSRPMGVASAPAEALEAPGGTPFGEVAAGHRAIRGSRCEWHGAIVGQACTDPPTGAASHRTSAVSTRSGQASAGPRDPTYANRQAERFAALDPQREGRALTQGEPEVNEDRVNGESPESSRTGGLGAGIAERWA